MACMRRRETHRDFLGGGVVSEGKNHFEDPGIDGRIIF